MAVYNIVSDWDWTTIPRKSALRSKAPALTLQSFKVTSNQAFSRLKSYINLVDEDPMTFYKNMYKNSSTKEDTYIIPYFEDLVRSYTNEYGDVFQSGLMGNIDSILNSSASELGELGSIVGATAGTHNLINEIKSNGLSINNIKKSITMYSSKPGSYIETPKLYQYMNNDAPLNINLVLSNSVNPDFQSKNVDLIEKLIRINRPTRLNAIEMEPPRIYRVTVHGLRHMVWSYCSSFDVRLLGNRRMINNKIIPEGYHISMSLNSLTTEVSNFMDYV